MLARVCLDYCRHQVWPLLSLVHTVDGDYRVRFTTGEMASNQSALSGLK